MGDAADNGTDGEEEDAWYEEFAAAEDVGQGSDEWLEDCVGEEVGCTRPEGVGCRAIEVDGESRENRDEDCGIQSDSVLPLAVALRLLLGGIH